MTHLQQSFFFDWNEPAPVPVPITAQCQTIRIKWARGGATGPDPVAPYTLALYTSHILTPVFIDAGSGVTYDLQIPFPPGTLYGICMYDSKGNTGGCQDFYSVYPTPSGQTCSNFTFPANRLNVDSSTSQYGWVPSCTELTYTPKGGTPPFTFTIAPALRPPINITSNSMDPIRWKIRMDHSTPFFVSLTDSTGLSWTNGPLHVGLGDNSCLSDGSTGSTLSLSVSIGMAIGTFVAGALLAFAVGLFLKRRHKAHKVEPLQPISPIPGVMPQRSYGTPFDLAPIDQHRDPYRALPTSTGLQSPPRPEQNADYFDDQYSTVAPSMGTRNRYNDLPSIATTNRGFDRSSSYHDSHGGPAYQSSQGHYPGLRASGAASPTETHTMDGGSNSGRGQTNSIFVVHQDGGAAPITLYDAGGNMIPTQELPPTYGGGNPSMGPSASVGFRPEDGRPRGAAPPDLSAYSVTGGRSVGSDERSDRKSGR